MVGNINILRFRFVLNDVLTNIKHSVKLYFWLRVFFYICSFVYHPYILYGLGVRGNLNRDCQ